MWVKICGLTNLHDAQTAVQAGADALGFIFARSSPRCLPAHSPKWQEWLEALSAGVLLSPPDPLSHRVGEGGLPSPPNPLSHRVGEGGLPSPPFALSPTAWERGRCRGEATSPLPPNASPRPRRGRGVGGEGERASPHLHHKHGAEGEEEHASPRPRCGRGVGGEGERASPHLHREREAGDEGEHASPRPRRGRGVGGEGERASPRPRCGRGAGGEGTHTKDPQSTGKILIVAVLTAPDELPAEWKLFDALQWVVPDAAAPRADALRWLPDLPLWVALRFPPERSADDALRVLQAWSPYAERFVLDTYHPHQWGGTGTPHDWQRAATLCQHAPKPVILAGGLNPENVANAIRIVNPAGVDVSSGVEATVGRKDPAKLHAFLHNAKAAKEVRVG